MSEAEEDFEEAAQDGLPSSLDPEVQILSIEFAEAYEAMSVTYIERRNVSSIGYKSDVATFDTSVLPKGALNDLVDTLNDLLDEGLIAIRRKAASESG